MPNNIKKSRLSGRNAKKFNESTAIRHLMALATFMGRGCNYTIDSVDYGKSFDVADGQTVHSFKSFEEARKFLLSKGCDMRGRFSNGYQGINEASGDHQVAISVEYDTDLAVFYFRDTFKTLVAGLVVISSELEFEDILMVHDRELAAEEQLGTSFEEWKQDEIDYHNWRKELRKILPELYVDMEEFGNALDGEAGDDFNDVITSNNLTDLTWDSADWDGMEFWRNEEFANFPEEVQKAICVKFDVERSFDKEAINEFLGSRLTWRGLQKFSRGECGVCLMDGYEMSLSRGHSQGDATWVIHEEGNLNKEAIDNILWDTPLYMSLEVDGNAFDELSSFYDPGDYEWDRKKFIEACRKVVEDNEIEWTDELAQTIEEKTPLEPAY